MSCLPLVLSITINSVLLGMDCFKLTREFFDSLLKAILFIVITNCQFYSTWSFR